MKGGSPKMSADETDNYDDIDQELEDLEDVDEGSDLPAPAPENKGRGRPMGSTTKPQVPGQVAPRTQVNAQRDNQRSQQARQQTNMKERYQAIAQTAKIMIVDTVREEVIAEGFDDIGTAMVSARMLNNQEKLLTIQGA